ncbi:MAG: pyruvate kinase [Candidatus Omnitrophica bacterium]|nr:pyruvate kinase [Candidatus Omnitrophota bacterium]
MVKTKIICTLGPASSTVTALRKMMLAGMDVARLNFSHSSPQELSARIDSIRQLNKKYRRSVKLLGDLEGHRIRIGRLPAPLELKRKQIIYLSQKGAAAGDNIVPFDYPQDLKDIAPGTAVYIDDGNITLESKGCKNDMLIAKVVVGGLLKEHKGVNIPGARLKFSDITAKDKRDIEFCLRNGLDYIAQSFVRNKRDILRIRELAGNKPCRIIAKIENQDGINNIDEIIEVSDGIMIARGDLGVSLPIYQVPVMQKDIIKKCNRALKPVITATQMLESMAENIRPTRAEVSDVANAIIDGSNYLMLSAETAVGNYPVETVSMMNQIIEYTEKSSYYKPKMKQVA